MIHAQGQNEFWLIDLGSANGTYVAWDEYEACLKREEMILPPRGRIGLGASPSVKGVTVLTFSREPDYGAGGLA